MFEKIKAKGKVTVRILDENGRIKRNKPNLLKRALHLPGKKMEQTRHNIITNQGDALLADLLSNTPARTKLDNTNGHIAVGTGYTGVSTKSNTGCNTQTGSRRSMDSGYPQVKGAFGASEDNVVIYRATFPMSSLNASGIDETALLNAATGGDCLAYAQISPYVNMTNNDTLQIEWEITFLGA